MGTRKILYGQRKRIAKTGHVELVGVDGDIKGKTVVETISEKWVEIRGGFG